MSIIGIGSKKKLLKQTQGKCGYCGKDLFGHCDIDHVIPKSKGGTGRMDNLLPSCWDCNHKKSNYSLSCFKILSGINVFWFEKLGIKKGSYIYFRKKTDYGISVCKSISINPYEWEKINERIF